MSNDVSGNANVLAEYITRELLDDEGVSTLGLLDALASCGLTLVVDEAGESSLAYFQSLQESTARQKRNARSRPPTFRSEIRRIRPR